MIYLLFNIKQAGSPHRKKKKKRESRSFGVTLIKLSPKEQPAHITG